MYYQSCPSGHALMLEYSKPMGKLEVQSQWSIGGIELWHGGKCMITENERSSSPCPLYDREGLKVSANASRPSKIACNSCDQTVGERYSAEGIAKEHPILYITARSNPNTLGQNAIQEPAPSRFCSRPTHYLISAHPAGRHDETLSGHQAQKGEAW